MRFLLDTDTVSFALRGYDDVKERMLEHRPSDLAVSAITVAELRFGAYKKRSQRLHRLIDRFLDIVQEVPFDAQAADTYGSIQAALQEQGEPIGISDTLIGAHALQLGLTLVTHNIRHFSRIEGLRLMDWVSSRNDSAHTP